MKLTSFEKLILNIFAGIWLALFLALMTDKSWLRCNAAAVVGVWFINTIVGLHKTRSDK